MSDEATKKTLKQAASVIKKNKRILSELDQSVKKYHKVLDDMGLNDQKIKEILDKSPAEKVEAAKQKVNKEFAQYMHSSKSEESKHELSRHAKTLRHDNKI